MKGIFILNMIILISSFVSPGKNPLYPSPVTDNRKFTPQLADETKALPPDLIVSECMLISVAVNAPQKWLEIEVSVKIKNSSYVKAAPSSIIAYYKNLASPQQTREAGGSLQLGTIQGGQFFAKLHRFQLPLEQFKPGSRFEFWIKADAKNEVPESNEHNNLSSKITITTPKW